MVRFSEYAGIDGPSRIKALLGPTNTGKTHRAINRMLAYRTGMIGLPLRLLAREVYDRVTLRAGRDVVALITGEERIIPPNPRYFICTVESMPMSKPVAFVAVDEIQLAAHPERGHTFTDRILRARGVKETWFLGSDTMVPLIEELVPTAEIETFPRLSQLSHTPARRLTRLPPRTAVVAFSAAHVYELAERLRAQTGGTAVVLGALSPRARNAQVAMYQAGEVQYLVATDAIGMGLNLDINHVAFGALAKFDGVHFRPLDPAEIGQIAGRAGRYRKDGTFGLTTDCANNHPFPPELIDAVERQRFQPLQRIFYRNSDLDFDSPDALLNALDRSPPSRSFIPVKEGTDHAALRRLLTEPDIRRKAEDSETLQLLWEVCRIPDFRHILHDSHAHLLRQIFGQLSGKNGILSDDWVYGELNRLDRPHGDIDALMTRIACVRTWTFVTNRNHWLADPSAWQMRAREIEDRLSDVLNEKLTSRFVDTRTIVLLNRFANGGPVEAGVSEDGALTAAGQTLGRVEGFRFLPEAAPTATGERVIQQAARRVLAGPIARKIIAVDDAPHEAFEVDSAGRLIWEGIPLAQLTSGPSVLEPRVRLARLDLLDATGRDVIRNRCEAWCRELVRRHLAPLQSGEALDLSGPAKGLLYQLAENLGSARREAVDEQLQRLTKRQKKALYRIGVRIGVHNVYVAALLKPKALTTRAVLFGVYTGIGGVAMPRPGATSGPRDEAIPDELFEALGYVPLGPRVIRIDMLERLSATLRERRRAGAFPLPDEAMSWLGCTREEALAVVQSMGYRVANRTEHEVWLVSGRGRQRRAG